MSSNPPSGGAGIHIGGGNWIAVMTLVINIAALAIIGGRQLEKLNTLEGRQDKIEARQKEQDARMLSLSDRQSSQGEKIAETNANVLAIRDSVQRIERNLERPR